MKFSGATICVVRSYGEIEIISREFISLFGAFFHFAGGGESSSTTTSFVSVSTHQSSNNHHLKFGRFVFILYWIVVCSPSLKETVISSSSGCSLIGSEEMRPIPHATDENAS